jgi:hypothetical protein
VNIDGDTDVDWVVTKLLKIAAAGGLPIDTANPGVSAPVR